MQFERFFPVDLDKGRAVTVDLGATLFRGDTNPLKLGIKLNRSGEDVNVSGTIAGRVVRADGTPYTATTDKSGNQAWLIVPQEALQLAGKLEAYLKIVGGGATAVTLYAYGTVKDTGSGTEVTPAAPVPNVEELQAAGAYAMEWGDAAREVVEDWEIATVAETREYLGL